MKKFTTILMTVSLALIVGGASLYVSIVRSLQTNVVAMPAVATQQTAAPAQVAAADGADQNQYVNGNPVKIDIPSLDISLNIIPGYYDEDDQTWTLTKDKAQYATLSTLPNNESGNTFVYGHAIKSVFASLPKLKSGAIAMVTTDNGHKFYYELSATQVVDPTNWDSVFGYQGKPILTLQTCTGPTYAKRQLFTFNLVRVA